MAIRAFAADHDLIGDAFGWFLAVIREMDAEYLGMRVPRHGQVVEEVAMSDHEGLKGLLRRLAKPSPHQPGREDAVA